MPNYDRTGPLGNGPRTGRGMGYCMGYQGMRCRRFLNKVEEKEILAEEKKIIEDDLKAIEERLSELKG